MVINMWFPFDELGWNQNTSVDKTIWESLLQTARAASLSFGPHPVPNNCYIVIVMVCVRASALFSEAQSVIKTQSFGIETPFSRNSTSPFPPVLWFHAKPLINTIPLLVRAPQECRLVFNYSRTNVTFATWRILRLRKNRWRMKKNEEPSHAKTTLWRRKCRGYHPRLHTWQSQNRGNENMWMGVPTNKYSGSHGGTCAFSPHTCWAPKMERSTPRAGDLRGAEFLFCLPLDAHPRGTCGARETGATGGARFGEICRDKSQRYIAEAVRRD